MRGDGSSQHGQNDCQETTERDQPHLLRDQQVDARHPDGEIDAGCAAKADPEDRIARDDLGRVAVFRESHDRCRIAGPECFAQSADHRASLGQQ